MRDGQQTQQSHLQQFTVDKWIQMFLGMRSTQNTWTGEGTFLYAIHFTLTFLHKSF